MKTNKTKKKTIKPNQTNSLSFNAHKVGKGGWLRNSC